MREYLGFGNAANSELRFTTDSFGFYIGEHNSDNYLQGRGIYIYSDGGIGIGYRNKGWVAPGNFISIKSDGDVDVGECYLKDGKRWNKCTRY